MHRRVPKQGAQSYNAAIISNVYKTHNTSDIIIFNMVSHVSFIGTHHTMFINGLSQLFLLPLQGIIIFSIITLQLTVFSDMGTSYLFHLRQYMTWIKRMHPLVLVCVPLGSYFASWPHKASIMSFVCSCFCQYVFDCI